MSDDRGDLFDAPHTEGAWAAYNRSASRYGRRHHDHGDKWSRYETRQDVD